MVYGSGSGSVVETVVEVVEVVDRDPAVAQYSVIRERRADGLLGAEHARCRYHAQDDPCKCDS